MNAVLQSLLTPRTSLQGRGVPARAPRTPTLSQLVIKKQIKKVTSGEVKIGAKIG